jgi:hypothetical protein
MEPMNEQIDHNDLLVSTRAIFVRTFVEGLDPVFKQSAEGLFNKADHSNSSQTQRCLLDAVGVLKKKGWDIKAQMKKAMEKLLHRSFQTTYSNYRPSFANSVLDGPITLIETSVIEDDMRFNSITERFRNEAGEQLRDLNIRIALIFDQENISERENPFRPYLFARAITMAIEAVGTPTELRAPLVDQLAEDFAGQVSPIYTAINAHLAENGIAAQLMLKPKRSPEQRRVHDDYDDGGDYPIGGAYPAASSARGGNTSQATGGNVGGTSVGASSGSSAAQFGGGGGSGSNSESRQSGSTIDRLFGSMRALASRRGRSGNQVSSDATQGEFDGEASFSLDESGQSGFAQDAQHGAAGGLQGDSGPHAGNGGFGASHAHGAGDAHGGAGSGDAITGATGHGNNGGEGGAFGHGVGDGPWPQGTSGDNSANSANSGIAGHAGGSRGGSPGSGHPNHQAFANGHGNATSASPVHADETASDSGSQSSSQSGRWRPSWLSGKKAVGEVLRRFFAGNSQPDDFAADFHGAPEGKVEGEAVSGREAVGPLVGVVQRLIHHHTPATPDMYSESGEIRNLIMERRSDLNEMTSNQKEQMAIDIVSMLFEFILRDKQVPAEVRAQLGRLQFLVLKIALRDESLLTTKAHPARMLVNRIGSISVGLKQVDPTGVAVTQEICRIVEAILADETENPNLFLKMLDDLDSFIAHELLTKDKGVATAVEAVQQAESRTLRLAHTCAQVSEALLGLNIHEHLRDFLENDWARAIEYAERNNPSIAVEYRALVPDLLWSVLPKVSEEDRHKLLAILPTILKTIFGGMDPIGWPAARKQTLMDWLFDTHTLVLRGKGGGPPPITFSTIHTHFSKFIDNMEAMQPSAPENVTPQNRRGYLEEAMRELDARINVLDHFFDDDAELQEQEKAQEAAAKENNVEEKPLDIAERLRVGVAIEVNLGGKPSTGRLNWISQNASNMVLTLDDQAEPSMISARMFRRLLRNDRVRFLEDEPIFERAVESLLSTADA